MEKEKDLKDKLKEKAVLSGVRYYGQEPDPFGWIILALVFLVLIMADITCKHF